jgi:hypothetical protein
VETEPIILFSNLKAMSVSSLHKVHSFVEPEKGGVIFVSSRYLM